MTDKQIEETLQRNAKNIGGGFDSKVLDYIKRLKAECDCKEKCTIEQHGEMHRLRDELRRVRAENENMHGEIMSLHAYIDNHEEVWNNNAAIDKAIVRKDTAKELLDDLKEACSQGYLGIGLWARQEYIKYGVEVDDE